MSETKGVQQLEDALAFGESLYLGYKAAKANDGKVDLNDFPFLITPVTKLFPAIDGADEIPDELLDVDDQEYSYLKEKYPNLLGIPGWQDVVRGLLILARGLKEAFHKDEEV